ncbi:MAG: hypothetical protein R2728_11350 [Chitinophagales bacterium]
MRKLTLQIATTLLLSLMIVSCSEDTPIEEIKVTEFTNLKVEGDLDFIDIQTSEQSDASKDLVYYNYQASYTKTLTFNINLENGHIFSIKILHENLDKVWETPTNYPIYPASDTSSHWKYCVAQYQISAESPSYFTHLGSTFPKGTDIDAFEIESYDDQNKIIRCRVRDMVLYKNTNASESLTINGTFVGAAVF